MFIRRKFSKGDNDDTIFTSLEEFNSYAIKLDYKYDEETDEDILESISIRINGDLYYYADGSSLDFEYKVIKLFKSKLEKALENNKAILDFNDTIDLCVATIVGQEEEEYD